MSIFAVSPVLYPSNLTYTSPLYSSIVAIGSVHSAFLYATALTGSVKLATNEIVLAANNTTTTKYYKFVVTYPNLPKDQSYNMEKEIDSYLEIRSSM